MGSTIKQKQLTKFNLVVSRILLIFVVLKTIFFMKKSKNMAKTARGKSPKSPTISTWTTDLVLTREGDTLISTVAPGSMWAGIMKFQSKTSVDGATAVWQANRYYDPVAGEGVTTNCPIQGPGFYRGDSSDGKGNTHVSNWLEIS